MSPTPIMLTGTISLVNGGLTNAIFLRANALAEELDQVILLTYGFHRDFENDLQVQYRLGRLNRKVRVYNLFRDLDPCIGGEESPRLNRTLLNEPGLTRFPDESFKGDGSSHRYFENGLYVMYKNFDAQSKVRIIDHFKPNWVRFKQETFDESGVLIRDRYMDLGLNRPRLDRYLSSNGRCYLTITLDKRGNNGWCYLHEPTPVSFENFDALIAYWLSLRLQSIKYPVLICDKREHVDIFKKNSLSSFRKIFVLHGNHRAAPHTKDAPVDPSCKPLFDHLNIFDKVIILTDQQRRDLVGEFGNDDKFSTISHPCVAQHRHDNEEFDVFNPHRAVTVARYEGVKALDEAIRAFARVVEILPSAEYHIFGYGSLKGRLRELICELQLEENVFLRDFTSDPTREFARSACSILTSKYEGFGLSITESMAVGTPVVSYDTLYGPAEIIHLTSPTA